MWQHWLFIVVHVEGCCLIKYDDLMSLQSPRNFDHGRITMTMHKMMQTMVTVV